MLRNLKTDVGILVEQIKLKIQNMYYLAKLRFESEDDNGKTKKIREQYLVQAASVGEAEKKLLSRFGEGLSPCQLEAVQESKILGLIE